MSLGYTQAEAEEYEAALTAILSGAEPLSVASRALERGARLRARRARALAAQQQLAEAVRSGSETELREAAKAAG